jgi:rhamnopyranosyl-N-acetylglucosaminyl-diphospho-decaprenol beta-1,3/1,4-galactofuranosyltransferase
MMKSMSSVANSDPNQTKPPSEGPRSRVAAIIATYNRRRDLEKCLAALFVQTTPPDAIYVVDNHSTDDTAEKIQPHLNDRVKYFRMPSNLGSAGGFRKGMELAFDDGYDWLWITDNDSTPSENSLETLMNVARSNPDVVALAPIKLRESDGSILKADMIWDRETNKARTPSNEDYRDFPVIEVDWVPNTGLLISRNAVLKVGHLRDDLFAFGEDVEYCLRIRKHSKILLVTESVVLHPEMGTGWPVPFTSLRKLYFLRRNDVYLSLRGLTFPKTTIFQTAWQWLRLSFSIVRKQDHRWRRLKVLTLATFHGVLGRLGPAPTIFDT